MTNNIKRFIQISGGQFLMQVPPITIKLWPPKVPSTQNGILSFWNLIFMFFFHHLVHGHAVSFSVKSLHRSAKNTTRTTRETHRYLHNAPITLNFKSWYRKLGRESAIFVFIIFLSFYITCRNILAGKAYNSYTFKRTRFAQNSTTQTSLQLM